MAKLFRGVFIGRKMEYLPLNIGEVLRARGDEGFLLGGRKLSQSKESFLELACGDE